MSVLLVSPSKDQPPERLEGTSSPLELGPPQPPPLAETPTPPASTPPRSETTQVVTETLALFILFIALARGLERSWLGGLQFGLVGWNFLAYVLMAGLALIAVIVSRRSLSEIGLDLRRSQDPKLRRTINVAVIELAAIWAAIVAVPSLASGRVPNFILPPAFFAQAEGWPRPLAILAGDLITLLFTTVFFGVLCELFYRGVIQAGLNRVFPPRYRFLGTDFGPGLIIASVLYAIGQGLLIYNGQISEPPGMAPPLAMPFIALIEGAILGFLFERCKSLIAPAILHAAIGFFFFAIEFPAG